MGGAHAPLFHVVLHRPEIPNNTGNIGRTCVALGAALHLIRPIAFDISAKAVRRAGLDYWPRLRLFDHASWEAYIRAFPRARRWYFSTSARLPLWDADFRPGDHLVFGSETVGLPRDLLADAGDQALTLPMLPDERSLNLATAACAALYEALRQCCRRGDVALDDAARIRITHPAANPAGPWDV